METVTPQKLKILKPINSVLSVFFHTKKIDEPIELSSIKNIIILDPTAIGDIIMSIPFLKTIKKNFKNAKITLVCAKHASVILEPLNLVDEFIIFNGNNSFLTIKNIIKDRKHLKNTIKRINKSTYDLAIEPRGDIRYLYFMHYFNAKRKISYSYSGGECFLTDVYQMPENYKETHIIEDKLYLLKQMGCEVNKEDYYPELIVDEKYKKQFKKNHKIGDKYLIGIHPGASKLIRQYPYYNKIVEKINHDDICFLIFKGFNEDEAVEKIEKTLKRIKAKYLIINETLDVYIKTLGICDIVLCNDSGAGHIAGAYGINTYVIFGPEKPSGIRPYNENNVNYINSECEFKPCYKLDCPLKEQYCFTKINTDEIAKNVDAYLKKLSKRK